MSAHILARLVETSLLEVNEGIVESAQAMGATPLQIIFKFILPEDTQLTHFKPNHSHH